VGLQVGLAQAFAGPVGERGHPVGRQAQQRRDVGGPGALDLGVPEDGAPPLGQRQVGLGDQRAFEPGQRRVGEGHAGVEQLDLAARHLVDLDPGAVVDGPADHGQQVGPEGGVRPAAAAHQVQDLGEGLGDHVLDLVLAVDELAGQGAGGRDVALVEPAVGGGVSRSDGMQELCVALR
jgi:hypothetical protein